MNPKKIICITGMHRSGTSLTASWLEKCGVVLNNTIIGEVGNIKGHFEDKNFVDFHSKGIIKRYPESKGWLIPNNNVLSFEEEEINDAKKIVATFENEKIWGWKDPRTTLFLNSWQNILPQNNTIFILLWRPFNQVVNSLINRSDKAPIDQFVLKITKKQSIDNWLYYNQILLRFKKQFNNSMLFPLDYVLNNSVQIIEYLNKNFQLNLNKLSIKELFSEELLSKKNEKDFSNIFNRKIISKLEDDLIKTSDLNL